MLANVPDTPAVPVKVAAETSESQIKVTFGTVLPSNRGSTITSLELQMDDGLGGDFTSVIGNPTDNMLTYYVATNVVKGREYRFKYRAKNTNGWSVFSSILTVKAASTPSKPPTPTLITATSTSMQLQFYKPHDNGGSDITSYELYINDGTDSNEPTTLVASYSTNTMTHTLGTVADSLTSGKIYRFKFRAINAEGNSDDSEIARFGFADAPSAPTGLARMNSYTTSTQIGVSWSAATATQSPGGDIDGYLLYMYDPLDG